MEKKEEEKKEEEKKENNQVEIIKKPRIDTRENVKFDITFDGSIYQGWQVQPSLKTVQRTITEAFYKMTGRNIRPLASGRTDAGVHAAHQIVTIKHNTRHSPEDLQRGLNAFLPHDIAILHAEKVDSEFHPITAAVGKHYRYNIHLDRIRPVIGRDYCWHVPISKEDVNVDAMNEAMKYLMGMHDFTSFRGKGCRAKTFERELHGANWSFNPPTMIFDVWGRGFLKQMVRIMVGTCLEVGKGERKPEDMVELLEAKRRSRAGRAAPALGLCLMRVFLDEKEYLDAASKALITIKDRLPK
jgi:tRNA pseudouridine38-40 synthase